MEEHLVLNREPVFNQDLEHNKDLLGLAMLVVVLLPMEV